jgi:hypothetical protein
MTAIRCAASDTKDKKPPAALTQIDEPRNDPLDGALVDLSCDLGSLLKISFDIAHGRHAFTMVWSIIRSRFTFMWDLSGKHQIVKGTPTYG